MRSKRPSIRGLAWLIFLLGPEAHANHRPAAKRCIEIMHVGSQDSPVGGVRMCIGEPGRSRVDSLLGNESTFYFDETTYRRLETFVVEHQAQGSLGSKGEVFSSFSVAWRAKKGNHKYILSPPTMCTYLDELVHSADRTEYAKFIEHGEGLMARERCPRTSALPRR